MLINNEVPWVRDWLKIDENIEDDTYLTIVVMGWDGTNPPRTIRASNPEYSDLYIFRKVIRNPYKLGLKTIFKYKKIPQKEMDNIFENWLNEITNNSRTV